ncbi:DUF1080 domain-containing protein [Allomuricauda sp. CP2A]|uniref:3-keto-disaccharide hydrolase n=1 Tax=Allomuricauda sp. CP2A TaxID=1848189 RepID=UPI000834AF3D|nr:DUF1080 domain-containing protein [Muricauda sp. CP2A]
MKHIVFLAACCLAMSLAFSQSANEATEPSVDGPGTINLLENGLEAWTVPSDHWKLEDGVIVADTGGKMINAPEWLYTKQRFGDFEFTCELRLTGDEHRNTGIYYRVNTFMFRDRFEAPSGYEFDAAPSDNYWGSLGDWYKRPQLRVYADPNLIDLTVQHEGWNRMTIRARGNRLEYWINGIKIMDFVDDDPKGSREGIIGFQIHNGSVMKMEYRNVRVLPL